MPEPTSAEEFLDWWDVDPDQLKPKVLEDMKAYARQQVEAFRERAATFLASDDWQLPADCNNAQCHHDPDETGTILYCLSAALRALPVEGR